MKHKQSEYHARCATVKSRTETVAAVVALASRLGVTAAHARNVTLSPRCVSVHLTCGDYRCLMRFDGASCAGAFLVHWHTALKSTATYPHGFSPRAGGADVNPYHRRKATTCVYTFTELLAALEGGFVFLREATAKTEAAI